jgi:hypothetical protein
MGGPEKCLGRLKDLQNLFDSKAFPRCPHPWIAGMSIRIFNKVTFGLNPPLVFSRAHPPSLANVSSTERKTVKIFVFSPDTQSSTLLFATRHSTLAPWAI